MNTSPGGVGLFGLRGWYVSFVLFLAFLIPVTPILAEIQNDIASQGGMRTNGLSLPATTSERHVSSYYVLLDLLGRESLLNPATAWFLPGGGSTACDAGRSAGDRDTDGVLWFFMGMVLTVFGVALAYLITPSVPESQLKDKSNNYASAYTSCYQDVAKSVHVKWAWYGLGTLFVACMLFGLVMLLGSKGAMSN